MFDDWFALRRDDVAQWLHHLHSAPEIGHEEHATAAFVADRLRNFGFDVAAGVGGTGVVGTLRGMGGAGRVIALRAELDALPMAERTDLPYRSRHPNRFHGCGHDGHMTTLLTAAAYLAEHRGFMGTVRVIFQPAEEHLTGARSMLADNLLGRFSIDEVYALHNLPGLRPGHVAVPQTAVLSSADDIDVMLRAEGAHGAMPHTGQDAMLAAAAFLTGVQQAATRVIDARDAAVVSFGALEGGTARNVLPAEIRLKGTMRTNDSAARDRLARLLHDTGRGVSAIHGVEVNVTVTPVAPVTVNHPGPVAAVLAAATRVAGPGRVQADARNIMASEDFSELLARVPGAYFFIGQDGKPPHHPEYVFDVDLIPLGAAIFADLVACRTRPDTAIQETIDTVSTGEFA